MGWIRISDDFYDNDKFSDVGPLGVALYFSAMGFCNRKLSDGFFKKNKARMLLDFDGIGITTVSGEMFAAGVDGDEAAKLVIEWMVAADLWHEEGHDCDECHARSDGGEPDSSEYLIHDYLKFQPSKAEVEEKAEANRRRVEAWRESRKNPGGKPSSNGVGNALRTPAVHDTPNPTPNPTPTVISSEITKEGGCVTGEPHQGAQPPQCRRHHKNGNPNDEPCRTCRSVKDWEKAQKAIAAADEVEAQRQRKTAREQCPRCEGTNTYIGPDGETYMCKPHQPPIQGAVNS